jgi:hypothetical protein
MDSRGSGAHPASYPMDKRGSKPTQPPIQWIMRAVSSEHEADHSSPSTAKIKNACSYTSTLPFIFIV